MIHKGVRHDPLADIQLIRVILTTVIIRLNHSFLCRKRRVDKTVILYSSRYDYV